MKFALPTLKAGDLLYLKVVEVFSGRDSASDASVIVSYGGDLLRVVNETGEVFTAGDRVAVTVRATEPLMFQIVRRRATTRGHLDVSA